MEKHRDRENVASGAETVSHCKHSDISIWKSDGSYGSAVCRQTAVQQTS